MQEPVDRAAMIEAASRGLLRQQQPSRRPRSKGSIYGDFDGGLQADGEYDSGSDLRSAESSSRRIRSAENQCRVLTEHREGPHVSQTFFQTSSTSTLDRGSPEEDAEEDGRPYHPDFDMKRPLSRKKDPSASAAAGLGAFSGPSRMVDAFEQRRAKQPIPVDSWGPRPPSRAGMDGARPKALEGGLDAGPAVRGGRESAASTSVGRPTSRASADQGGGNTRASAWAEPLGSSAPRGLSSEARRGRQRTAATRSSPEVTAAFRGPQGGPVRAAGQWASVVGAAGAQEDSPLGWPDSPLQQTPSSAGSPPTRKGRQQHVAEAVSVEDFEPEGDLGLYGTGLHGSYRRDATPPQVIITRSSQQANAGRLGRRGPSETRGARERNQRDAPFDTSLDADFLSLFAS